LIGTPILAHYVSNLLELNRQRAPGWTGWFIWPQARTPTLSLTHPTPLGNARGLINLSDRQLWWADGGWTGTDFPWNCRRWARS